MKSERDAIQEPLQTSLHTMVWKCSLIFLLQFSLADVHFGKKSAHLVPAKIDLHA